MDFDHCMSQHSPSKFEEERAISTTVLLLQGLPGAHACAQLRADKLLAHGDLTRSHICSRQEPGYLHEIITFLSFHSPLIRHAANVPPSEAKASVLLTANHLRHLRSLRLGGVPCRLKTSRFAASACICCSVLAHATGRNTGNCFAKNQASCHPPPLP